MIKSIQHFEEEGTRDLQKIFDSFVEKPTIAEMVYGVTDVVTKLGCDLIAEEWESYDEIIRKKKHIRQDWYIVRKDPTTVTTSLGDVTYSRTYFRNKNTGEYAYLLDTFLGLEKHARMTEDAVARMMDEAVDSCYRKGGENVSIAGSQVSKETVMHKLRVLRFPEVINDGPKKEVENIYIDADEDHVSLQFLNAKGDIEKPKQNTIMPRIVYVYEGVTPKEDGTPKLINTMYFGGVYEGSDGIEALWKEVYNYIDSAYDLDKAKNIYINGDGAHWIKSGTHVIRGAKFVLDKYHMYKYILSATSHLLDSKSDAQSDIYRAIYKTGIKGLNEVFDKIVAVTASDSKVKAVETSRSYMLANWAGIQRSMKGKDKNLQCSAEGHVSHVFSDRMSSRPMGWSKEGCDRMARLRIYKKNGGNMLDLVRYQAEELPLAAGAEEFICTAGDIIASERAVNAMYHGQTNPARYTIPYAKVKKIAALKNHIYGL